MSDIIEDRCILCGASEIQGAYPVCKGCQEKEAYVKASVVQNYQENRLFNRAQLAEELDASPVAVDWYVHGIIDPKRHELITGNLSITQHVLGKYMWLEVGGKIDSMNAELLKKHVDDLILDGWQNMVMELSKVAFFSSTGIRVVLATYKQLNGGEKSFNLENPSDNVRNVLGLVALDTMLLK